MAVQARRGGLGLMVLTAILLLLSGSAPAAADNIERGAAPSLLGAGSTFDYPFFQKAFTAYSRQYGVAIRYQSVGSSAGIERFTANQVDFGATDVPMNDQELALAVLNAGGVVQVPVTLGGIAIAYRLPGVAAPLRLDGPTLAAIFLGSISRWNDPAIAKLNPTVKLPNLPILTVHRSDGSGTTYIMTDYLSTASSLWFNRVGRGKTVPWPVGIGGNGNAGVAAVLQAHPGAIAYLELSYAIDAAIPYAMLQNKAGAFVLPTAASIQAAGAHFPDISSRHYSIVDADGVSTYPIAGYSWVLLRRKPSANQAALVALFRWLTTSGQQYAAQVHNVPLPPNVQQLATSLLATIPT